MPCPAITREQFAHRQQAEDWHVLGVMGYAGRFRARPGDPIADFKRDATWHLRAELTRRQALYGDRLVTVSGATNAGILRLTYDLCATLGITAAGITADQALRYKLAVMDFVVPVGAHFGDESAFFVASCHEFVVVGGGDQSMHEAELAAAAGKRVTAIRGFGGAADEMTTERISTVTVIDRSADPGEVV